MKISKKKILCRIFALVLVGVIGVGAFLLLLSAGNKTITVTALNESDMSAAGVEVWIERVEVNGKGQAPEDLFSDGWIHENGYLKWRDYDQPEGMNDSISATFPSGTDVDIQFQTNKWRGIVQVQEGGNGVSVLYRVNCYRNSEEQDSTLWYLEGRKLSGIRMDGKTMAAFIFGALLVLMVLSAVSEKRWDTTEKDGKYWGGTHSRELWLDVLKVASAPLVVLIHTVGGGYSNTPLDSGKWLGYLFLNTLPRCAVPIFIMVSGILLLGKPMTIEKAWCKAKKAMALLVFWNLAYILAQAMLWGAPEPIWKQVLKLPVKKGPDGHLWYSYFLVWLYLFAPIVSVFYQALSDKKRMAFIVLTVVAPGILDFFIKSFSLNTTAMLPRSSLYMSLPYIGMMFIGRMIYDYHSKIYKNVISAVAVLTIAGSSLGMMAVTYLYSQNHGTATDIFIMAEQLLAVLYGAGIVLLVSVNRQAFEAAPEKIRSVVVKLSRISLGIYFFHCLMLKIGNINLGFVNLEQKGGPLEALALTILYYLLTLIAVKMMERIPMLRGLVE